MRNKVIYLIIFGLSLTSLLISMKLFWNLGIYVDEYGTSPDMVSGGDFWLYMDWLRLFILGTMTLISGNQLLKKDRRK